MPFRNKLLLAWAIVLLGALGLTVAGVVAAQRSLSSELSRARTELMDATNLVAAQMQAIVAAGTTSESLWAAGGGLLDLHLEERPGVEGGVWLSDHGFVAYAFPSYDGSTPKTQLPAAELPRLQALAERAAEAGAWQQDTVIGEREALIRVAQPLAAATPALVVWTMKRIPVGATRLLSNGAIAAGVLLLLIVMVGAWLAWTLSRWNVALGRIGQVLSVRPLESMPMVPLPGVPELDEIASAVNALNADLREARGNAASLVRRPGRAELLPAVGRVSAGMAHEIRNPLAAIRLRAENALADAQQPKSPALQRILDEVDRLERLVRMLLDLGREIRVAAVGTDVRSWLAGHLESVSELTRAANVRIETEIAGAATWEFDPVHLGRALDNLLANALQVSPPGGRITVQVTIDDEQMLVRVVDQGPGVPAGLEERIFEPFFTTREGGTGFGLALVREIAEAHGGSVVVAQNGTGGACIEMRIPCPAC